MNELNCFGSVGRGIGNWWNWESLIQLMRTNVRSWRVNCKVIVMIMVLVVRISMVISIGILCVD